MSQSIEVQLGDALPVSHLLPDGASGLFPQAVIRDEAESVVATLNLTEVGSTGRYTSSGYTPTATGFYVSHVIVYTDAGHTIEATTYTQGTDTFEVVDINVQQMRCYNG